MPRRQKPIRFLAVTHESLAKVRALEPAIGSRAHRRRIEKAIQHGWFGDALPLPTPLGWLTDAQITRIIRTALAEGTEPIGERDRRRIGPWSRYWREYGLRPGERPAAQFRYQDPRLWGASEED